MSSTFRGKEKVNDENNMKDTTKMFGSQNKSWQNLLFRRKKKLPDGSFNEEN